MTAKKFFYFFQKNFYPPDHRDLTGKQNIKAFSDLSTCAVKIQWIDDIISIHTCIGD